MTHDPVAAILDMLQAIERARKLSSGITEMEFLSDERSQWAVYSQLVILGEAAGRLEPTFQGAHKEIPWSAVIGMRHRLVHGYDSVDWVRVWKTIEKDLPSLLEQLQTILAEYGGQYESR